MNDPADGEGQRLAHRCGAALATRDALAAMLGIELLEIGPGTATMRMTVREDMINGQGSCHGGILFTIADAAFGYACNSRNEFSVAAGAQIEFVRPAGLGDTLTATARERWQGGRSGLYDIEVRNQEGEPVALAWGRARRTRNTLLDDPSDSAPNDCT